jgi:hypothetical protein
MWDPQHLTTLYASTACYGDSFTYCSVDNWTRVVFRTGHRSLSLISIIEELLERKSSSSRLEKRNYSHRGSAALTTRQHSIQKKLALASPTSDSRSAGIVLWRTQATEFVLFVFRTGQRTFREAGALLRGVSCVLLWATAPFYRLRLQWMGRSELPTCCDMAIISARINPHLMFRKL